MILTTTICAVVSLAIFRPVQAQDFWEQANGPFGGRVRSLAINAGGDIFAGTEGSGVFRSTDNGDNWTQTGLGSIDIRSLAINSVDVIFAGTSLGVVFRSTDNGDSWTEINNGLTWPLVSSLAINSTDHIFAGTSGDGVFRSTDNGDNWVQIGLTNNFVQAFTINASGHIFAGTGGGVFRSTDNGNSWTQISTGISNINVQSLAINSADHIFAGGAENGVFRSTDDGDNWTDINNGLTNTIVSSLAINSTSQIFAGTFGGVYRSLEATISVREVAGDMLSSFRLSQNYPNPFNPETMIDYALPIRSNLKLIVYNLRGEEVALLINGTMPAGTHRISWDASGYASGVYLYRLQASSSDGGFVRTRKMLLLK